MENDPLKICMRTVYRKRQIPPEVVEEIAGQLRYFADAQGARAGLALLEEWMEAEGLCFCAEEHTCT